MLRWQDLLEYAIKPLGRFVASEFFALLNEAARALRFGHGILLGRHVALYHGSA
jgi:hypothetical protein